MDLAIAAGILITFALVGWLAWSAKRDSEELKDELDNDIIKAQAAKIRGLEALLRSANAEAMVLRRRLNPGARFDELFDSHTDTDRHH